MKNPFSFLNRARKKPGERITAGGNMRPGTVVITAPRRFGVGLDDYMQAIRAAEDVDFTRRVRLYDIYEDALLDPHLFSVMHKRKAGVLCRRIEFRRDGVPDEAVNDQIKSPWFMRFVEDALDAQFWGFSLVQFFVNEQGWIDYFLVPRKHVDPVLSVIKRRQDDLLGTPFDSYPDLLMIRGKEPLGILARCTPYVIYKKGTMGDWSQYSEIFGMPVREYVYDSLDPDARENALRDAEQQGGATVFVHDKQSELNLLATSGTGSSNNLYSDLVDRCNAEISKAVLCNTLTTEASDTGTQALGTVHRSVEESLAEQDARFVLDLLNYDMADIFASMGVNTQGGEFVFVEEANIERQTQRMTVLEKAHTVFGLPMDDDYLYGELDIERPDDYDRLKQEMQQRREQEQAAASAMAAAEGAPRTIQPRNSGQSGRFFARAPHDGALEF